MNLPTLGLLFLAAAGAMSDQQAGQQCNDLAFTYPGIPSQKWYIECFTSFKTWGDGRGINPRTKGPHPGFLGGGVAPSAPLPAAPLVPPAAPPTPPPAKPSHGLL